MAKCLFFLFLFIGAAKSLASMAVQAEATMFLQTVTEPNVMKEVFVLDGGDVWSGDVDLEVGLGTGKPGDKDQLILIAADKKQYVIKVGERKLLTVKVPMKLMMRTDAKGITYPTVSIVGYTIDQIDIAKVKPVEVKLSQDEIDTMESYGPSYPGYTALFSSGIQQRLPGIIFQAEMDLKIFDNFENIDCLYVKIGSGIIFGDYHQADGNTENTTIVIPEKALSKQEYYKGEAYMGIGTYCEKGLLTRKVPPENADVDIALSLKKIKFAPKDPASASFGFQI